MDHRKSLTLAGAADEDLLALRDDDTSFYELDSDLELLSDDSDSDAEPAEKIPLLAEPEASSGDEIFYSGDKLLLGSQDSEDVTAREGYIAAQLRDSVKHGCKLVQNKPLENLTWGESSSFHGCSKRFKEAGAKATCS